MTQQLLEKLEKFSKKNFQNQKDKRSLPDIKIPVELAGLLDDSLNNLPRLRGVSAEEMLSGILVRGLVSWYSESVQAKKTGVNYEDNFDDSDDPDPATAQMQADAYVKNSGMTGYTAMTMHSISGNGSPKKAHNPGNHPQKKQRNRRRKSTGTNRRQNRQGR